jgi:3-isopropylmalate/(R)-2-methylmalate dehydratase large subunit
MDHNVSTDIDPLKKMDQESLKQLETLKENCLHFGIECLDMNNDLRGIVHVIGPELGLSLPGKTIVCGDSHTSTHGALGCLAFGIGTSQITAVLATQCIAMKKPKSMLITLNGTPKSICSPKDIALYILHKIGTNGATEHFIEFCGEYINSLSIEGRMTLCNMAIEMGARGGIIAPDEKTLEYIKGRKYAPEGRNWMLFEERCKYLFSEPNANHDEKIEINIHQISPRITFGNNPAVSVEIDQYLTSSNSNLSQSTFEEQLNYLNLHENDRLENKEIDYVFIGSCTNSRIEDLRIVADIVKGKKKAKSIKAYVVPGSMSVLLQAKKEGIDKILLEADIIIRQPGCSACIAMNEDKIPSGAICLSTSNRNFEGRQGKGSKTILASPLIAAITIIEGKIISPPNFFKKWNTQENV